MVVIAAFHRPTTNSAELTGDLCRWIRSHTFRRSS
jgi:hypothetical protein